jgi:hypothetical protein
MATLTQLVDTVAAVEGLEPSAVSLIARYVREAGLITTGGRGGSAAKMNLADAANLLIGVNATATATDAAETVSTYRNLEAYSFLTIEEQGRRTATRYGTLGEAIEQLIDAAGSGELPDAFMHKEVHLDLQDAFSRGDVHIDLRFRTSDVSAFLQIAPLPEPDVITSAMAEEWVATTPGWHLWFAFYPPKPPRTRLRGPPGKKKNRIRDRIEETKIGYSTLSAVGKLLRPRG